MTLNVHQLKEFFSGFFQLDVGLWAGFLAGWENLPNNQYHNGWFPRLAFGVQALSKLPINLAVDMLLSVFTYNARDGFEVVQSVTPLLGEPETFENAFRFRKNQGDLDVKKEAMNMIGDCGTSETITSSQTVEI
mmetsp:Transcript_10564/g.10646  ORF Transcript_10564/g.10646 Transcript_10564/m.10646 type:complete len:134 (-) Transcript_10564:522-923(-)